MSNSAFSTTGIGVSLTADNDFSGNNTFDNTINVSALTASQIVATDASKNLQTLTTATYPSLTELSYVKGVTSAIQTQIGTKVTSGGALGTPSSGTLTNCTFPTLNQNTTGSAATLTTPRTIGGVSFNGAANITVASATGGFAVSGGTLTAAAQTNTGILYLNGGVAESAVFSNGNSGTSKALNLDNGNLQSLTITGAVTITLTTPTYPGKFTVIITQDGTGHVYSISGVKFPGGTAPSYSTAASTIDVISLIYDGANWYGMGGIAFS